MRILLVGEYSRLHNTLKEGLLKLGHEVTLVGTRDGFKNFPVDHNYEATFFSKSLLRPLVKLVYKLTKINLINLENGYKFKKLLPKLKGYDVVQLINEKSINTVSSFEIKLIEKLMAHNKKLFLLSTGVDYLSVKYALKENFKYSILTPYLQDSNLKDSYRFVLNYMNNSHKKLHQFLVEKCNGIISTDFDYHLPLVGHKKYLGMIPNPINLKVSTKTSLPNNAKINIFHGINRSNYIKKGNRFFEEAIDILLSKYSDRIDVISTCNLPYDEYINAYDKAHIILDQVFAYDQGYNALEAMAKGKVVFTGAEQEWLEHYNLNEDQVVINALPDAQLIASKLEWLILNPDKIIEISEAAKQFIEKEHDYVVISKKYLQAWEAH